MGSLAGKVACVTGAARGQGRSHSVALAKEGVAVIAVDACTQVGSVPYPMATREDLEQTVAEVEAVGGSIVPVVADVRDLAQLRGGIDEAVQRLGRLDIVSANAGISTPASTFDMDEDVWQDTIDINLTGVWKTCRVTVPHLLAGGRGGSIVITSSAATQMISGNIAHYTASKAGLIGLMKVMAKELAPSSVRVNTIHPAGVSTPMILNDPMYRLFRPDLEDPTREDFEEAARSHNVMQVAALAPEDVSAAVVYLASDAGRYITGTTHFLDAGGSLR